jgi:hypothetical protein
MNDSNEGQQEDRQSEKNGSSKDEPCNDPTGDTPAERGRDFFNSKALQNFLEGLEEKIGPNYGRISSHDEKIEVKRDIARDLGLEDTYSPRVDTSPDDDWDVHLARCDVNTRYDELLNQGKIQEVGEAAEQTKKTKEWFERIDAHLRGEKCIGSDGDNTV